MDQILDFQIAAWSTSNISMCLVCIIMSVLLMQRANGTFMSYIFDDLINQ